MIKRACPEVDLAKSETKVAISGSGNVAQYAALKVIQMGGKVVSLSDSRGAFVYQEGFKAEDVEKIAALKLRGGSLRELESEGKWAYHDGARPWTLVGKVDIALPCATQNEVSGEEADALVNAGVRIVAEGSNMVSISGVHHDKILIALDISGLHARGHRRLRKIATRR